MILNKDSSSFEIKYLIYYYISNIWSNILSFIHYLIINLKILNMYITYNVANSRNVIRNITSTYLNRNNYNYYVIKTNIGNNLLQVYKNIQR